MCAVIRLYDVFWLWILGRLARCSLVLGRVRRGGIALHIVKKVCVNLDWYSGVFNGMKIMYDAMSDVRKFLAVMQHFIYDQLTRDDI